MILPIRLHGPAFLLRLVLLTCCLVSPVGKAYAQASNSPTDNDLEAAIKTLLDAPGLQSGFHGVFIESLVDHRILFARNADHVFMPASNNKLLTSSAALGILGPDFTYHTRLLRQGTLSSDGTLHGDLILQGAGDPGISIADLDDLAKQAAAAGLKRIRGSVYFDDSLFDRSRIGEGWAWDYLAAYYAAQNSALNANHNVVDVTVTPGKRENDPAIVQISPADSYMTVANTAVTGVPKSKFTLVVDRPGGANTITVAGTIPSDWTTHGPFQVSVTVDDPSRFAATLLRAALVRTGIKIQSKGIADAGLPPTGAVLLAEHISAPLSQILKRMNKPSDNLYAECLLKTVGAKQRGQGTAGSDGTGAQSAREWFGSIGLDLSRLSQADGSGLSRLNLISPHNFVRLLEYVHSQPYFPVLFDSLSIAGVDGTLQNRMRGTAAADNCHAKDGYIGYVSTLSGYVTDRDGDMIVFSMMMNNNLASNLVNRNAQDKIVALLANYSRLKPTGPVTTR